MFLLFVVVMMFGTGAAKVGYEHGKADAQKDWICVVDIESKKEMCVKEK